MNTKIEDWQVTAFALGELSGEEAAEVARLVEADPAVRTLVEDARRRAGVLAAKIAAEQAPVAPVSPVPLRRPASPSPAWVRPLFSWFAAAACIMIVGAMLMPALQTARKSRDQGRIDTHPSPAGFEREGVETRGRRDLAPGDTTYYAGPDPASVGATRPTTQAAPPGLAQNRAHSLKGLKETKAIAGAIAGPPRPQPDPSDVAHNTETYVKIDENDFLSAKDNPLSTFSIDVDTASYANVRRFLTGGMLPPPDAVRIEELINYFSYDYAQPDDEHPFAVHLEMAACPWKSDHRLLRIGLKGREIDVSKRPPSNLVFLLDVSGSMNQANKLPLVKSALSLLTDQLTENDRVSIVVYAGASGLVLPPTTGDHGAAIRNALENLSAGGSTNGGAGIHLAYATAMQNFIQGGTNRVILATDGDWNVGTTNQGELVRLIEEKAKSGVFLSVLGFGMGNYKDDTLERLADRGNGNYGYIDSLAEARKLLVEQMSGTLCTIAKDVKIQIEFNPARVAGYRLIGYENRLLAKEDFNDDKKDAGEIGAGHTVTALYEVVPAGLPRPDGKPPVDPLKYQEPTKLTDAATDGELCTVKLRYKAPQSDTSTLMEVPLKDEHERFDEASEDFRFAASVAGYGMLLRQSEYAKGFTWDALSEIAAGSLGVDKNGYRAEFIELVKKAKTLSR